MWAYEPLSGVGAKRHGGRFNRPGVSALYTSLDPTTAWLEAQQGLPFKAQPMTLVAYRVDCTDIIDLTDLEVRRAVDTQPAELGCAWEGLVSRGMESPIWSLVERLREAGAVGAQVRSYAPGCTDANRNLVFWDWNKEPPHSVQVVDDMARLPKTTRSWTD